MAEWARSTAAEHQVLNDAASSAGRLIRSPTFEDEHYWAREMLARHVDPEFGEYIGVREASGRPGIRWSATWDEGSHNEEVYGGLLGLAGGNDRLKSEAVL